MHKDELESIQHARDRLDKGFYVNNLYELAKVFGQMSSSTKWPATACFALRQIALIIAYDWDGRPLPTAEAQSVDAQLRPLFSEVLSLMAEDTDVEELYATLDRLVLALLDLEF